MNLEEEIQRCLGEGDLHRAATRAIEGYGPEIYGFLVILVRDPREAGEVFSQTCEDLWTGLASFEARCSMRTWLYTLARHAAVRLRRSHFCRPELRVALSEVGELAERVRTETHPHLRTDVKDRFAIIRDALEEDDRTLLVLRVDRAMSWKEIARVFSPEDENQDALDRVAVRLRKRFQLVKDEIRARARQAGLLPSDSVEHAPGETFPPLALTATTDALSARTPRTEDR